MKEDFDIGMALIAKEVVKFYMVCLRLDFVNFLVNESKALFW